MTSLKVGSDGPDSILRLIARIKLGQLGKLVTKLTMELDMNNPKKEIRLKVLFRRKINGLEFIMEEFYGQSSLRKIL